MNALVFPDLSHHRPGVNLAGAPAVMTKATEGASFVDPTFGDYKAAAAALGILFGGFHWVDTADLSAQARNAVGVMGRVPAMWDCEADGATVPRILDLTTRYRALGGVVHLCYLPHWWWADHLGSPDLRPLAAAGLALVSSNYPAGGYSDTGPGWAPYGGVMPAIWQFTDAGTFGGRLDVDLNAYRGSIDELRQLWTGEGMEQSDLVQGNKVRRNTVGNVLGDQGSMRDWWYGVPGAVDGDGTNPPPAGSRLDVLARAAEAVVVGGVGGVLPAEQVAAIQALTAAVDGLSGRLDRMAAAELGGPAPAGGV
ncbi:MAG TPA: GH25 family lysozyme [Rugosimonospora sp.]|nr:GH25 family lysozyme [Rugosimonospora sp.]